MKKNKILLALALLVSAQIAVSAPMWQINNAGEYTGVTGLDVNGTPYDVTLFGDSWDDAVAAFDPDPIYSFAFATAARDAFHNFVFDNANPESAAFVANPGLSAVATPLAPDKVSFATVYDVDSTYTWAAMSCIGEFYPGVCTSNITFNGASHNRDPNDPTYNPTYDHYLVWTESVPAQDPDNIPEPSAFALLGLGLLGFVASRRRKATQG